MTPAAETARQGPQQKKRSGHGGPGGKANISAAYQCGRQAIGEGLIVDQVGPG